MAEIKHPVGLADSFEMTATGAQAVTIIDDYTLIDGVTVEATSGRTLDLIVTSDIGAGARLTIKHKTNAAETLTFGTAITAPVLIGVAGKTYTQSFTYDGTNFLADGAALQDDGIIAGSFAMSATGAQAVTITNDVTIIDGITTEATGNRTIDLTINSNVRAGARIHVRNKSNGTETLTLGTLIAAVTITGSAGKTNAQSFTFDGTDFMPDGLQTQID